MLNILYLVHRIPYPPDKGDRIRSYHLLRFLRDHGRVSLGCLVDEPPSSEVVRHLRSLTERLEIVPVRGSRWVRAGWSMLIGKTATEGLFASRRLKKTVADWALGTRFDVVVLFCSSVVQFLSPELDDIPVLFDCVDVDSEKWLQYAKLSRFPKSFLYWTEGRRLGRLERSIGSRAKAVLLATEPEAEIFRRIHPDANILAIHNGVRFDYFSPIQDIAEDQSCIFVGSMDYKANEDAVRWFARNVWPGLIERWPEMVFRIVGRDPTPAVCDLAKVQGIEVVGAVADVRPFVARSAVSVAPLLVARGIQNKLLEAMSMQKAVVASTEAITGLAALPGRELLCARTPAEWVSTIDELLADPSRRRELGIAGREYVERNHHWDRCLSPLADLLPSRTGAGVMNTKMSKRRKDRQTDRHRRILQLVHSSNIGGAEILAERFSQCLGDAEGVVFGCLDDLGPLGERLREKGFTALVLDRKPGLDLRCGWRLGALYRRERIGLVHAHQYTPFFYAALARLLRGGPPILFTEHGRFHPDLPNRKRILLNPWLLRKCDRVVAVGESVKEALVNNEGIARDRIEVVYNGIDLSKFSPTSEDRAKMRKQLRLEPEDVAILTVARLDSIKDHATSLRALRIVKQRFGSVRLLFAGEGPEQERIEALIEQQSLRSNVCLLGLRRDVPQLLAAADIFLLTSVSEGIPLTLIEAMAARLPIVATRVGGIPEVVVEDESGLLAPSGDEQAVAEALLHLIDDPQRRHQLGERGREIAASRFDEKVMMSRYQEIYHQILGT